jgi:hypothetical protein
LANNIFLVYSTPKAPEREAEYHIWYNHSFLQQVLRERGFLAATRFKLSHVQMDWFPPMTETPHWPYGKDAYLTLYEIDPAEDPRVVFESLAANEKYRQSRDPDADPITWGPQWFYEAITERETKVWLEPRDEHRQGEERPNALFIVPTSPVSPEVEPDYDKWYMTQMNIREPGIVAGTRYKLSAVQCKLDARAPAPRGEWPFGQHSHLMLYELDDIVRAQAALRDRREQGLAAAAARGADAPPPSRNSWMKPWGPLRRADEHIVYEPISYRVTSIWIRDPREI